MNPILWRKGVCDPHAHVFNNKVYIYATHDTPYGMDGFRMEDWQIYSSEDLIDWKLEQTIDPSDFYCGKLDQCWAVDAACKDGKYFWYFSTGDWGVGVGVGKEPAGPFEDALGEALLDYKTEPCGIPKWDPCVFQDDDGNAYIIVGDCRCIPYQAYMIAKLSENMTELAEPLRKIEYYGNICPEDKASIHKYNGRYYLTHSSSYAVSDNVYGPYQYMGNTGCNVDHGSYFTYRNQTYFASGGMDNPNRYYRASFLAPCHYRNNGEIVIDQEIMQYGCGQYDATWEKIAAVWYFESSSPCKKELEDHRFVITLKDGEYLVFPHVNHVEENPTLKVRAAAANSSVKLLVREKDQRGKILGHCYFAASENWEIYQEMTCELNSTEANLDLCFEVQGEGDGELLRLESFSFVSDYERCAVQPALSVVGRGAVLEQCPDAAWGHVLKNLNLKNTFLEAVADGGSGGEGVLEIYYQASQGNTELHWYVNGTDRGVLQFQYTGMKIRKKQIPIEIRPGINRIRLECTYYQNGYLAVDHVLVSRKKENARTYSAANGQVFPRGNGCWDGLPQRECDPQAYTGRAIKYLGVPGHGFILDGLNGGMGGNARLLFHYARGEKGTSSYVLRVNGVLQKDMLHFSSTESFELCYGAEYEIEVELLAGTDNRIELIKTGKEDRGIFLDGITVIPKEHQRI